MKKSALVIATCIFLCASFCYGNETSVLFSPNGGCQDAIIKEIAKAQKTIDIAMYYLTSREIAQELVRAKDRNVKVRIVLDQSQENQAYSKSRYLIKRGLEIKYYVGSGLMHNKFAIIDGNVLITGSFNWTATANEKNEENLLIMTDKDLIKKYQERFEYLWEKSRRGELKEGQDNEE
jgi:phosphatidylserine/phosphatidylglycerophosphate/cardiolipin synthase-like enzyme